MPCICIGIVSRLCLLIVLNGAARRWYNGVGWEGRCSLLAITSVTDSPLNPTQRWPEWVIFRQNVGLERPRPIQTMSRGLIIE